MRNRYGRRLADNFGSGFRGCSFCEGRGCLACAKQAEKAYDKAFPSGPQPIFTWTAGYSPELASLQDDGCPNVDNPLAFMDSAVEGVEFGSLAKLVIGMMPTRNWVRG